jgi:hypothetical protein
VESVRINLTGFSFDADTAGGDRAPVLEPLAAARIAKACAARAGHRIRGRLAGHSVLSGLERASELVLVESRAKKAVFLREALHATAFEARLWPTGSSSWSYPATV